MSSPSPFSNTSQKSDLGQKAWLAYLRQELTAPATALAEYAHDLAEQTKNCTDHTILLDSHRILERARRLQEQVHQLTIGSMVTAPHSEEWRSTRHDLRANAAFIIMACETIRETTPDEFLKRMESTLASTIHAARSIIMSIEDVVKLGQANECGSTPSEDVREMLARLLTAVHPPAQASVVIPGRILLVDDNEYGRDLVGRMLVAQGHQVEMASGGIEAQNRLSNQTLPNIDLILLDVMMPGMTGPELLQWIKADARFWHIPVIMVSALGEDEGVLSCIAAGAEDYLTRPINSQLLRARITGSLEKKRLRDRETEYQARIDELVRAIIPPAAVSEWEQTGTIRPKLHPRVGVLFLDVVGFTALCEKFREHPEEVIELLQTQVEQFEKTAARHGVQKIKTIGDAFLGVIGLADSVANPARTLVECGEDLIADARRHPAGWQVRVGLHVGPVVSGILGKTQFGFDIWGHTVNMAARIEGHGRPNRVTLSDEAWHMLGHEGLGESREVVARGIGIMTVWDFLRWSK